MRDNIDMADQLISVPLSEIHPSPDQTRIDMGDVGALAKNIDEVGLLFPPIIRKREDGPGYWLVDGERRWRATQKLGRKKIDCILRQYSREEAFIATVSANTARDSFNPVELAASFAKLKEEFHLSGDAIAQKLKLKSTLVYDYLALHSKALDSTKKAVTSGKLGAASAIEVARIAGERLQTQALEDVLRLAKKEGEQPRLRDVRKLIQSKYLTKTAGVSKSARSRQRRSAAAAAELTLRQGAVRLLLVRVGELVERRAHLDETDLRMMALATAEAEPSQEATREVFERRGLKPSGLSKVGATQLRSLVVELALAPFVALEDGDYSAGTKAVARAYGISLGDIEKTVAATIQADALFEK